MKKKLVNLVPIFAVILLALFLRVYKLGDIPPSINWDEAAVGHNAFSIANFGRDEWGNVFPLVFKSFEDYKHPVHIYITSLFVKFLGLSDFSIRLPAAVFGVFNVVVIYLLVSKISKSRLFGFLASLFLAVSPYNLQFSRFNHELNFTVFFFMLGIYLFYLGLEKKNFLLPLSFASFGISLFSYHSAKIVVPLTVFLLLVLYTKRLLAVRKFFLISLFVLAVFVSVIILNPNLLGTARIKQTSFSESEIQSTALYQKTGRSLLGFIEIVATQYKLHFRPKYLFISGDGNTRHSTQVVGEFYKFDAPFLAIGTLATIWLIVVKRSKEAFLLAFWALIAPLPAAAVNEAPHSARAMFMTGSWHIIAALGLYCLLFIFGKRFMKVVILTFSLIALGYFVKPYLENYYQNYAQEYAIEWQYGMADIVDYISENPDYVRIYMTDERHQPYIFFLYYLKYPEPLFFEAVRYNERISKSYNLVLTFDKYQFGGWDPIESKPLEGVLYVVTPSQYNGLRHKASFDTVKSIYYPDGSEAFHLVTAKKNE